MDITGITAEVRKHPEFHKAGMLLCHIGVVRGHSQDGREVRGLQVKVDHKRLAQVISDQRGRPGIIDVRVEIAENRYLAVGEDVMVLVVAGDVRENVIAVLSDTLNSIKSFVTEKTEYYLATDS